MIDPDSPFIQPFNIFAALLTAALVALGLFPYPALSEELVLFIGRFHPLVVHMPIGFITAVVLLQLVSVIGNSELRPGISTLLWFTMISAILSSVFGTLLAIPGGYDPDLLRQHRWLGIGTSIACVWMLSAHRSMRPGSGLLYSLSLLVCVGLVGVTGHWGGSLTHGEDYLTAYLPASLGGQVRPEPVDPGTREDAAVFARVIQPMLQAKCVSCHGPGKQNGDLRMDSMEALLAGGKHGPALQPGRAAESLMIQRMRLPHEDKLHMPPKGKLPLREAEIECISWWIDQGAPERLALSAGLPGDEAVAIMESALGFAVMEPRPEMLHWAEVVEASRPLQTNTNVRIRRVALDGPAVDVFFEPGTNRVDDLVHQLLPIRFNIVLLDLGHTLLTEAALENIGTFGNLEQLRLQHTAVTDEDLRHLAHLRQLEKLNLYGTDVTDEVFETLKRLPRLRQVNTFNTKVTHAAAAAFIADVEDVTRQRSLEQKIRELKTALADMQVEVITASATDPAVSKPVKIMFEKDEKKYGKLISPSARVTVSSTSQYDPPEGLKALVQDGSPDLPFAFHTQAEPNPWVQFRFDQPVRLNAVRIQNRPDVLERAAGLVLESYHGSPSVTLRVTSAVDDRLTEYALGQRLTGRYVVMRLTGGGSCNPGGTELLLGTTHTNEGAAVLSDPVKATASSEYSATYAVGQLFDSSADDAGVHTDLGRQYAGLGPGPHVVVYDMGASVTFDRILYAQRPVNACDRVDTIECWVTDADPGTASTTMPLLGGPGWQEISRLEGVRQEWSLDLTAMDQEMRTARVFRLLLRTEKEYLHLKKVLLWGSP